MKKLVWIFFLVPMVMALKPNPHKTIIGIWKLIKQTKDTSFTSEIIPLTGQDTIFNNHLVVFSGSGKYVSLFTYDQKRIVQSDGRYSLNGNLLTVSMSDSLMSLSGEIIKLYKNELKIKNTKTSMTRHYIRSQFKK